MEHSASGCVNSHTTDDDAALAHISSEISTADAVVVDAAVGSVGDPFLVSALPATGDAVAASANLARSSRCVSAASAICRRRSASAAEVPGNGRIAALLVAVGSMTMEAAPAKEDAPPPPPAPRGPVTTLLKSI